MFEQNMNYFHADSSEKVQPLPLTSPLLTSPLLPPLHFFFWLEMTGAEEEGKGGDGRRREVRRGDGEREREGGRRRGNRNGWRRRGEAETREMKGGK